MALVRVAQYSSTPTVVGDYQAQNAHLQAFTNQLMTQQFILDSGTAQPVIKQGCYVSHGGSLYIADADTAITGSPSDGSVYIRVSGTTSLTVEFVNDISGYAWNPVYTALTSGSYTLLPYLIVKASTVWTRYNFNPNNQSFGAIKATSIDTGSGAMTFDQGVKTTDSPTFATPNATTKFSFASAVDAEYRGSVEIGKTGGDVSTGPQIKIQNNQGAVDKSKYLRVNATGGLEVVNNAYNAVVATISDDGLITTELGPNAPVDNNDASMPSVGTGGFSYATASTSNIGYYPSTTIGSGGTWVYIAKSIRESSTDVQIGRIAGGSTVQGVYPATSSYASSVQVIAWRIA